jgi:hypothetical protein
MQAGKCRVEPGGEGRATVGVFARRAVGMGNGRLFGDEALLEAA